MLGGDATCGALTQGVVMPLAAQTPARRLRALRRRATERGGAGSAPLRRRSRAGPPFTGVYDTLVGPWRLPSRVVVLADARPDAAVNRALAALPARELHLIAPFRISDWQLADHAVQFHAAGELDGIEVVLRRVGACDVIVNLMAQDGDAHDTAWRRLFLHVAGRGCYVVPRDAITAGAHRPAGAAPPAMVSTAAMRPDDVAASRSARELELRRCMSRFLIDDDVIALGKTCRHYLKVRDAYATELLSTRLDRTTVRECASLPPGTVSVRGTVSSHPGDVPVRWLDRALPHPTLHLREYHGDIALVSNALLVTEHTALPDSFRHSRARYLTNPRLRDVGGSFARRDDDASPRTFLPGVYYHLDSENSGHYGHLMTEVISRLWGWDRAKSEHPDLKAIFRIRTPDERDPVLERRVLGAYGIAADDIVWVPEPVWLDTVVAATPMWHNQVPHYVHPDLALTWRRIAAGIADMTVEPRRRLFVSRSQAAPSRSCRNTRAVEEFFAAHGYDVIYPETMDLSVQAGTFAKAQIVAGFGGSALYNVLYAQNLEKLIVLNSEAYTARGEHLFSALLGCDTHYFWSAPDVAHPPGRWYKSAYYSPWSFDFDRNGAELDALLRELG